MKYPIKDLTINLKTNPVVESLNQIVSKHQGRRLDKWSHYPGVYERHLSHYRGREVTILEIGVNHGGSIDMWRQYFGDRCRYIGVDINPKCREFEADGVEIFIGDQSDRRFLSSLADSIGNIDILIDDGGHSMVQQWTTFEVLYPRIAVPGVYICEDTHTSYFPEFGGGKNSSKSFIRRIQRKVDELSAWHYQPEKDLSEFTKTSQSMHFYDSVVVIEKARMEQPLPLTKGDIELPKNPRESGTESLLRKQKRLIGILKNRPVLYRCLLKIRDALRKGD